VALFDLSWRASRFQRPTYLRTVVTPFNRTLRQSPIEREPRDDGNARYPQPNGTSQASGHPQ
jgi:hypothetical protein